jgi:hypothetical protein
MLQLGIDSCVGRRFEDEGNLRARRRVVVVVEVVIEAMVYVVL